MSRDWKCPCGGTLEPVVDEVDIGVGIQRHIIGAECPSCGTQYATCNGCGSLDFQGHQTWCKEIT